MPLVKGMFSWFYKLDDRYHSWLRSSDMRPVGAEAELLEGGLPLFERFRL